MGLIRAEGEMEVKVEKKSDEVVLVSVSGSLSFYTVDQLDQSFDQAHDLEPNTIGVDFRQVTLIDSTGFGSVIRQLHRCTDEDRDLVIFGLRKNIELFFKVSALDKVFRILTSEQFFGEFLPEELAKEVATDRN